MSEAGDLLAAGSLILAVLAVLYSIWYPDAQSALNTDLPSHYEDALPQLEQIRRVLKQEIVPLVVTSFVTTLIFLPKAIGVVIGTGDDLADNFTKAVSDYDPVQATLVFVVAVTAFLCVQMTCLSLQLRTKLRSRSP
jgi:hypothetical protein